MTSEIALMNRRAVALAADSATTVGYWQDGARKQRYFKGANKIFNLSKSRPVGVMTYDSANLQGVPWEVLIKSFRDRLGKNSHPSLNEYAANFFSDIEKNSILYPHDFLVQTFCSEAVDAAGLLIYFSMGSEQFKKARKKTTRKKEAGKICASFLKSSKSSKLLGNATPDDVTDALNKHHEDVKNALSSFPYYLNSKEYFDLDVLVEIGIRSVFSSVLPNSEKTGLVIAGFGDDDYFPRLVQYQCYGNILGKFIYEETKTYQISQQNISELVPLAQSEMVETFIYGVAPSATKEIEEEYVRSFDDFCKEIEKVGLLLNRKNIKSHIDAAKDKFTDAISNRLEKSHVEPLRDVVGMLPIDELADLAETLISIESLKERVTRGSEEVSGPIDVAVISKSDGFIWIKRKHYFDSSLNPRYFSRQTEEGTR